MAGCEQRRVQRSRRPQWRARRSRACGSGPAPPAPPALRHFDGPRRQVSRRRPRSASASCPKVLLRTDCAQRVLGASCRSFVPACSGATASRAAGRRHWDADVGGSRRSAAAAVHRPAGSDALVVWLLILSLPARVGRWGNGPGMRGAAGRHGACATASRRHRELLPLRAGELRAAGAATASSAAALHAIALRCHCRYHCRCRCRCRCRCAYDMCVYVSGSV